MERYGMKILDDGELDFLSLGALVHRLDPGIVPFRKARECQIHVSGGEYNCAANLADCFGLKTGIASAIVDYPIGDLITGQVRAMGVRPYFKHFTHNGVNGPNMATVFSDRGFGVRPPVVFYNRSNEAAGLLQAGDFEWRSIFGHGVRWFHSGGIFAALSKTTGGLILEAMQQAKQNGAVISFDLNYRAKLWSIWGGQEQAQQILGSIMPYVDVLVGNEEDIQLGLGIKGPEVSGHFSLDAGSFIKMIEGVRQVYPNVHVVATTLREVHSSNRHSWGAVAWINGETYLSPTCDLDVFDRVGGGDGFASGLFYGLLSGENGQQAVNLGWAHGALVTTYPGDTTMATLEQVRAFARGGSARIQR